MEQTLTYVYDNYKIKINDTIKVQTSVTVVILTIFPFFFTVDLYLHVFPFGIKWQQKHTNVHQLAKGIINHPFYEINIVSIQI